MSKCGCGLKPLTPEDIEEINKRVKERANAPEKLIKVRTQRDELLKALENVQAKLKWYVRSEGYADDYTAIQLADIAIANAKKE